MGVFNIFNKQQRAQNAPAPYVNPAQKQANNEYLQQVQNAEAGNNAVQDADMQSAMQAQTQNLINQQNYDQQMQRYQNGNVPLAPQAQETVKPVSSAPQWDMKKNADLGLPQSPQQKQPQTWEEFRDAMYGNEAKKQKQSDRRAKVMAIGDALRHIGNLSTTIAGASPQKYSTAPASQERATYEQGRAKRDAMGYQMYQQKLNQDIKNREMEIQQQKAQVDANYKKTQMDKIRQDMVVQAEKYPYEIQKMVYDTAKSGTDAEVSALKLRLDEQYEPLQRQANIDRTKAQEKASKAAAAASWATKANRDANTQLANEKLKNYKLTGSEQPSILPSDNKDYVYLIGDKNIKNLHTALQGEVSKNPSFKAEVDAKQQDGKKITEEELVAIAYGHLDDPNIKRYFDQMCRVSASNYDENVRTTHTYK